MIYHGICSTREECQRLQVVFNIAVHDIEVEEEFRQGTLSLQNKCHLKTQS